MLSIQPPIATPVPTSAGMTALVSSLDLNDFKVASHKQVIPEFDVSNRLI